MTISYIINGAPSCGKNNVKITKEGRRYPNKKAETWLKSAYQQIGLQKRFRPRPTLTIPLKITIDYWPSDNRVRDIPAILDGIFHVLERMLIIDNDRLFKACEFLEHQVDRKDPRIDIQIETWTIPI